MIFYLKVRQLKRQCFHTKLICQRPMLREIEWGVENGPITKSGVLTVTNIFF